MSHPKGLLGTCPGKWVNSGKPNKGTQQQRCSKCGRVRNRRVRRCWFFHDMRDTGQPRYGVQKQKCQKCGMAGERQKRPCWPSFLHQMSSKGQEQGYGRCLRCGTVRMLTPR
jgi:hypothetical protein